MSSQLLPDGGFADRSGGAICTTRSSVWSPASHFAAIRPTVSAYLEQFAKETVSTSSISPVSAAAGRAYPAAISAASQEKPFSAVSKAFAAATADSRKPPARPRERFTPHFSLWGLSGFQIALPESGRLLDSLQSLRSADGAYSNHPGAQRGLTTSTAAAVLLLRHLGAAPDAPLADWLLARAHPQGGFFALPDAPIPDLLSTATALHALAALQAPLESVRDSCLDFVDSLWTNRGGFFGTWADDAIDCEYTYYALLSLGSSLPCVP